MSSILEEICRTKRERVAELRRERSFADLESSELYAVERRSLSTALRRGNAEDPGDPVRFLCEIKRASPSAGWIRPGADAVEIAEYYERAGASGLSLLTEEAYFKGVLDDLPRVREVGLPVLMKDFFVDPYQVVLARSMGADALLLIAALGDRPLLREMRAAAKELGLDVLLEVHDEWECEVAHELAPELSGVNNRNLKTFEVDLATSERLYELLPKGTRLAESGIKTRDDVVRLERARFDGLLVGESLMRKEHPGDALLELRGIEPGEERQREARRREARSEARPDGEDER